MDHYWQTDWGCINREQPKHTSFFLIRDGSSSDAVSIILLSQNEKYWHFFQLGRLRAIFLILVYWMHAIVIIFLLPMRNRICYAYIFPKKNIAKIMCTKTCDQCETSVQIPSCVLVVLIDFLRWMFMQLPFESMRYVCISLHPFFHHNAVCRSFH